MKKQIITLVALCLSVAVNAQTLGISVLQNGSKVSEVGTATVNSTDNPVFEFDENGNAVTTVNGKTVASLPMTAGGAFSVNYTDVATPVTKSVTDYTTVYSPFQLVVPSGTVEVYAPTFNSSTNKLDINSATRLTAGTVVPVGTALVLKNTGSIQFSFSTKSADDVKSDLSGTALSIEKSSICETTTKVLTLDKNSTRGYGFYRKSSKSTVDAGTAYYLTDNLYVLLADDTTSDVNDITVSEDSNADCYNILGQRVSKNTKGIVIINGKKYIK